MLSILGAILVGLVVVQFSFIVTTVYLHRALAHRALTLAPPVTVVFRVLIWMATGTRPRQWVAVHRKHHASSDKPGDPHSPFLFGFPMVQFGNAILYRRYTRDTAFVDRYTKDLPADRWDKYLFDHGFLGLGIGITILCTLMGWELGLIAAGVQMVLYLLGGGAINAIGHWWGRRPYDNLATNNQWLALLVAGEGLHNNHHAASTSPSLALAAGEMDPGWWAIRVLVFLRQA